jgi:hypothetical protein
MGRKRIAVLLLTGYAQRVCAVHLDATRRASQRWRIWDHCRTDGSRRSDPEVHRNDGLTLIMVDGQPYSVPTWLYNQVTVGTVVKFDGTDWTIISGGM